MEPHIKTAQEIKLLGIRRSMSLAQFSIAELWSAFMPRRSEIAHCKSNDLFSIACYPPDYFESYSPFSTFERWAAVEVSDFECVPAGLEAFTLSGGLYAVFRVKGLNSDHSAFQYFYNTWIHESAFVFDNRPHFEVLGEKYRNDDPQSEEDIWIPLKPR